MGNFLSEAKSRSLARSKTTWSLATQIKQQEGFSSLSNLLAGDPGLQMFGNQRRERRRYEMFRGWLYSAINALAFEGAGQPVSIVKSGMPSAQLRSVMDRVKGNPALLSKHEQMAVEIIEGHPLSTLLSKPNGFQHHFQFVYSFISNLLLTGWSYIILDEDEEGPKLYSIPTTWITPDHKDGPFSAFKIQNPHKSQGQPEPIPRENVAFAHLPNPSNPLGAMAPASSQMMAIRIDDHIQTSQEKFFENGIFPSMVVTVGKNPHPDVPGGIRPRLTRAQRAQVYSVIKRTVGGMSNYGVPAIVDGMIEKFERLSATQNEMGWEKSEVKIKRRILSAYGLHEFVLGENLPGSYAQAYVVDDRTCRKVNVYLSLLGNVLSNFVAEDDVNVFYHPCEPRDPMVEFKYYDAGLKHKVISGDEFRAKLGLPAGVPEPEIEEGDQLGEAVEELRQASNLLRKM